ncbi:MAG: 50S ribosomal protein L10 [Caldisericia bacterium]|nr:50S ribosomal protein L10 [Caldisericia bacterium]
MITKERKLELLNEIEKKLDETKIVIFTTFNELPVSEISPLRRELKSKKGEFKVYKNTLLKKVFDKKGYKLNNSIFNGTTAVVFAYEDPFQILSSINNFLKTHKKNFDIKGGIFGKTILSKDDINSLSTISSINEVYGKLIYSLKSPLIRISYALKSPMLRLINALNEIKSKKE